MRALILNCSRPADLARQDRNAPPRRNSCRRGGESPERKSIGHTPTIVGGAPTESGVIIEWVFSYHWRRSLRVTHDSETGHLERTKMRGDRTGGEAWFR